MSNTSNFNLPLLAQNQAQKEVTINESLYLIDALINNTIIDYQLNVAPASANNGDTYLIAPNQVSNNNAWHGHNNKVAVYLNGKWRFIPPNTNMVFFLKNSASQLRWNGTSWSLDSKSYLKMVDNRVQTVGNLSFNSQIEKISGKITYNNGKFTLSAKGRYLFNLSVRKNNAATETVVLMGKNTSNITYQNAVASIILSSSGYEMGYINTVESLNNNDYITFKILQGTIYSDPNKLTTRIVVTEL